MKYLIGMAALLLSFNVYSQEIVVVEKQGKKYALVTSCTTTSRPTAVSIRGKPEKGSTVILKTRKKTHKCEVTKAVFIT
tara:strand:+ start:316 stop:552 length:237 start_codon:yes stop_codon:yes gene_type:complete